MVGDETASENIAKKKRGEMIVICGAKGGTGRTLLSVNIAVALSKNNNQVCIVDGDFQFGDVCLSMDLHPSFTLKDIIDDLPEMDAYSLSSYLMNHNSGVKVLAAPDRPEYSEMITNDVIQQATDLLLQEHDYVIVDTGVGMQEHTLNFIEKADQIFLLTTMEISSIKNTKTMIDTLDLLGVQHKVQIILNRSTMESVVKSSEVPDLLGAEEIMNIPNDFPIVSQSLNSGIPFVQNQGKSEIAKSVFKVAEQLISRREIAVFKPKGTSFLQSIFSKRKSNLTLS